MKTITVYNKGKRVWTQKNADGQEVEFKPETSIEMEEASALRLMLDYPREFVSSKVAGPSSSDLARQEQSLRDRTANLEAREKGLEEREAAIKAREDALEAKEKGLEEPNPDKAALLEEAKALGLDLDGRMGINKIKEAIEGKKKAIAATAPEVK